jgi:tRNA-2-methylthio-N6-dimethylallyladenosine synthase
MEEARRIVDMGYTEIQLLGQNVNSYRDPSPAGLNFAEMLARVAEVPGIRRVRYTTSHPRDFTRQIVEAMDANPAICNHVHLPVQSGSTNVLRAMLREYTREDYLERIAWIRDGSREAKREISLTTDIIVGFPGETDADFEQTITLLEEVGYDSIFSFQYSPRPNTASLALPDIIPDEVKGQRLRIVQDRQRQIQAKRYQRFAGMEMEVLVEGTSAKAGEEGRPQWKGRTGENLILNFTVPDHITETPEAGSYWRARVLRTPPNCLIGEAVGGPVYTPTRTPAIQQQERSATALGIALIRIL